jgi:hypothetical protein
MNIERSTRKGGLLIGLNGVAQSGKDTVGKILCDNHGFKRLAFADALRKGLYEINPIVSIDVETESQSLLKRLSGEPERINTKILRIQDIVDNIGWDEAKVKYIEIRELMQRYGTEGGRLIHGEYCWVNVLEKTIKANPTENYVITDMRFDNEVSLVGKLDGLRVQIQREGVTSVNNHISDKVLPRWMFDHIIHNNGTIKELEEQVNELVISLSPYHGVTASIR